MPVQRVQGADGINEVIHGGGSFQRAARSTGNLGWHWIQWSGRASRPDHYGKSDAQESPGADRSDVVGQGHQRVDVIPTRTDGVNPERPGRIRPDGNGQVVGHRVETVVELQNLNDLHL